MSGGILHRVPKEFYIVIAERIEFRNGIPYWLVDVSGRKKSGDPAGTINGAGYREIRCRIEGRLIRVKSYRLQWFMVHGNIPDYIDHVNGCQNDDRIENLREATHSQNMRNRRKKKGVSRFHGVYWESGKRRWRAVYNVNGMQRKLGLFQTEEEAAVARDSAVIEHGYAEWSPLNFPQDKITQQ